MHRSSRTGRSLRSIQVMARVWAVAVTIARLSASMRVAEADHQTIPKPGRELADDPDEDHDGDNGQRRRNRLAPESGALFRPEGSDPPHLRAASLVART